MSERYLLSPCCNSAIDVHLMVADQLSCSACSKVFAVREDMDFAEFSTGSTEFFRWSDDGSHVVRFYFHNMTLDQLEGVAERIKTLSPREKRPLLLLPIFKAIHDCIKKRLQQHLVFDRVPNLSVDTKAWIESDLPLPGNNLVKLLDFLVEAYPVHGTQILRFKDSLELRMLLWIRNKEEHIAVSAWPLRSFVHVDKAKLPSDDAGHVAELSVRLAAQLLNSALTC